jgi:hypothetical protein
MTRTGLAFGGLLAIGALLWLVVVWPAPRNVESAKLPAPRGEAGRPPLPAPPPMAASELHPTAKLAAPSPPAAAVSGKPEPALDADPHLPPPTPELFAEPHGPLDEYKQQFESEPRDSAAGDAEHDLRAAFEPEANSGLLRNVLCRQTICRAELQWKPSVLGDYVAAMGRLTLHFDRTFAVAPLGPAGEDKSRSIELYMKRGASPGPHLGDVAQ